MTEAAYNKYTDLKENLLSLKDFNQNLDIKDIKEIPIIKIGWLELTFGNGSSRVAICNDPILMDRIKNMIIKYHNEKIKEIEQKMINL